MRLICSLGFVSLGIPPLQDCEWFRDLCDVEPNPGPSSSCLRSCGLVSSNVSSFRSHGLELLNQARRRQIPVVCFQELNPTKQGIPSVAFSVRRAGLAFICSAETPRYA